ncbi:MAG: FtsX-like permease family protein [Candidatus Marinimicrobia bacterium]|nr:FtsX-like permease family protein [Candidatus Neomarinimicrobiota bacterium]
MVVGFIVLFAAILISSYTIKLAIFAKRDLIWTMRLVGATDSFIRRPFVVEGMVEGLLAGIVAIGILEVAYRAAGFVLRGYLPLHRIEINNEIYLGMLLFGLFLGWFSSNISVRKYLREKM